MKLNVVNHIAIICSEYEQSLKFYCELLGFEIISEEYRAERKSMMTKLALNGTYLIELFTFPDSPARLTNPEACGLRHLAFTVSDIEEVLKELDTLAYPHEPLRVLPSGERCFFMKDPDGLPIEICDHL